MFEWLFGKKQKKPAWNIILHSSVQSSNILAAAWTVYAGTKFLVRSGRYFELHPEVRGRRSSFDEECFARDALAEFWEAQSSDTQATDPYLQVLVSVRQRGLIREYVWRFLRKGDWTDLGGLNGARLDELLAERGITQHKPLTLSLLSAA